jgi:hypothetical protein
MILVIVHWKSNNTLMNNNKKLPAQAAPKTSTIFLFLKTTIQIEMGGKKKSIIFK